MTTASKKEEPKNLIQKLCEVISELGPMKPDGFNTFHKYHYFSDEQISSAFRDKLAKRNILLVPQVLEHEIRDFETDKGKHSFLTTLKVMWTFYDGDDPASNIVAITVGQGDDPGDKGANKATTGAFKYLLIKMGQIGGEGDAEADEGTDRRHAGVPAVNVGPSNIQGIAKGGRSTNATEAQVKRVSVLAKDLGIDARGVNEVAQAILAKAADLPDGDDPGPAFVAFLGSLSAEEIGSLVTAMTEMKEADAPEPDDGYA